MSYLHRTTKKKTEVVFVKKIIDGSLPNLFKPILHQLAEVLHSAEYLQQAAVQLSNEVLALAEKYGAAVVLTEPDSGQTSHRKADLEETAVHQVWKPGHGAS